MSEKKYTADDVSDDVEKSIVKDAIEILVLQHKVYDATPVLIAEAWNHAPDCLKWRWEDRFNIYIGGILIARIDPYGKDFIPKNVIDCYKNYSVMTESEARLTCEKIADEFIKQITNK